MLALEPFCLIVCFLNDLRLGVWKFLVFRVDTHIFGFRNGIIQDSFVVHDRLLVFFGSILEAFSYEA